MDTSNSMTFRRFRDTDPNSRLRRRIAFEKLRAQLEDHWPRREEMEKHLPPECQTYLNGKPYDTEKPSVQVEMSFETARAAMDIPRITMSRPQSEVSTATRGEGVHHRVDVLTIGNQKPNSTDSVALHVPEEQLQMIKYQKAVEKREEHKTLTEKDRFMVSCPSPAETWRMEKEYADYTAASRMLKGDFKNDKNFHSRRGELRQYLASQKLTPEQRRQGLLRSGGRASKLREVISIDEDWPQ
ncbi:hypothetical protein TgHK011_000103 [Trichoderma gracile]|nr:hypothetical protein TgHK011_000103 [Trichoderma gracile]